MPTFFPSKHFFMNFVKFLYSSYADFQGTGSNNTFSFQVNIGFILGPWKKHTWNLLNAGHVVLRDTLS